MISKLFLLTIFIIYIFIDTVIPNQQIKDFFTLNFQINSNFLNLLYCKAAQNKEVISFLCMTNNTLLIFKKEYFYQTFINKNKEESSEIVKSKTK